MKTVAKWIAGILLLLLGLIGAVLVISFLVYPPEYVSRALRWGVSDVYDYQKFPEHTLDTGPVAFNFDPGSPQDTARVQAVFESGSQGPDLDTFLEQTGTQAFLVIQDDTILYENYFNGASRESIVTSFSIAKSFTSALVGIAIAEGHIASVNDPITDYLPELADRDPAFAEITIRDLLMMSSGIEYEEFPFLHGDDVKTYYHPDLRTVALDDTHIIDPPGSYFLYNNFHPLLLGMILERATGTSVAGYLQEKIWQPLGMQYPGSWSLDSEATAFEKMESGINGRAIDFAKFGRLYLQEGNWDGQQLIPSSWVIESTQPDETLDQARYYPSSAIFEEGKKGYYKYMWWGMRRGGGPHDFSGYGNHGQFLYISPQKGVIIVRHGETYGQEASAWFDLFHRLASDL